ncbi:transposase, partial [Kitasatospora cystarginea]|uniref:transposase n=1 Tax=Kitasatospora cystarginea TaxID=58350 RepID=UPI0031D733C0
MGIKSNMAKRYTAEFKRDAVALVRSSPHRNVTEIARELGVSPEGLRGWVKQDRADRGEGRPGELTSAEREELTRDPAQGGRLFRDRDDTVILFRFVDDHHDAWGVKRIRAVLGIPRSSFYAWRAGEAARRARLREEELLAAEISVIHLASRGAYGVPRVHELR